MKTRLVSFRFLILIILLVFAVALYGASQREMSENEYLRRGVEIYLDNVAGRTIKGADGSTDSVYRHPQNVTELQSLFPTCCRFSRNDPDSEPIGVWRRYWYRFGGFVFIKAGLVKVRGTGPKFLDRPYPRVVALDKSGRDITRIIIPR